MPLQVNRNTVERQNGLTKSRAMHLNEDGGIESIACLAIPCNNVITVVASVVQFTMHTVGQQLQSASAQECNADALKPMTAQLRSVSLYLHGRQDFGGIQKAPSLMKGAVDQHDAGLLAGTDAGGQIQAGQQPLPPG
ncbi:hypothetical protein MMC29_001309 [Sticta canariensis]|nr:hypothetical protein [Sticta canariensis]